MANSLPSIPASLASAVSTGEDGSSSPQRTPRTEECYGSNFRKVDMLSALVECRIVPDGQHAHSTYEDTLLPISAPFVPRLRYTRYD